MIMVLYLFYLFLLVLFIFLYLIIILITLRYYLMYNLIYPYFLLASCLSYIFILTY